MDASAWDERYSKTELEWGSEPNRFLVAEIEGMSPGVALDVASGEARNAVWLAERGWAVTAVDFSKVGVEKGRRLARQRGVDVTFVVADVIDYQPSDAAFDLVVVFYLQLVPVQWKRVLGRTVRALKSGGTLLIVGHDRANLTGGVGGLPIPPFSWTHKRSCPTSRICISRRPAESFARLQEKKGMRSTPSCARRSNGLYSRPPLATAHNLSRAVRSLSAKGSSTPSLEGDVAAQAVNSPAMRSRDWFVCLFAGVFVLLVPSLHGSAGTTGFTPEIKMSTGQLDDWEPSIAADTFGHVYWATTRYGGRPACRRCPDPAIVYRVSSDGGETWSSRRYMCRCAGVGGQHDPVLAVDDGGRVFAIWMNDFEVNFARSDDFGATWTRAGALDGALRYSDKPWIGVSDDGDDVYITFNANGPAPGAPYAVYSHNAGATWSPPIRTRNNRFYWFAGGLIVTPDGTAFSSQVAYPQEYDGHVQLYVQRSSDGGRTWDTIGIDRSRRQPDCPRAAQCPPGFLGPQMAVASDDAGRVYILYNANKKNGAPTSLFIRWSDDNGKTWSLPQVVGRARGRVDHEFPMIAATGTGDVRIAWMDNRTGRWNAWYKSSMTGGATWSARERMSNQPGGAPYKSPRGFKFPYGDYGQLAIDGDGITHATWGEGPHYVGPGGSWYARSTDPAP